MEDFMAWQIDPIHSQAVFAVRHMVVSTVRGHFNTIRGTLEFDEAHPENASIEAEAEVASIDTHDKNRDADLRSPNFFDAEKYPLISFKSTKVERAGDNYKVTGDFTMHGVTRPVVFDVEYGGTIKDPYGMLRAGINGRTKLSRKDWGLTLNPLLETGGAVIGDEVKIEFELEAVKPAVPAQTVPAQA
jgi:polyisoprenoid-binding protein YceI